jgi:flagellar motor switch protein FliM
MENTLSQVDIDVLMRSLLPTNGEDLFRSKGNAVPRDYDFRRPTKFKKDMLRTLVMVHENFARLLQSFFMSSLRTSVQVHVRSTSQYLYTEYTQLLLNPSVVGVFRMNPLPGLCLLDISPNVAFAIIDRVFGGLGSEVQPQRGLSEIELSVIRRTLMDLCEPLREAWRSVADVEPTLEAMETNPAFLATSSPTEVVASITLGVQIGEHIGHIAIVLPYSTVAPVVSKLSSHRWFLDEESSTEPNQTGLEDLIQVAPVQITAVLGGARINVGEFMALQIGDIIALDTRTSEDMAVFVGNTLAMRGRPGRVGNRMAIQVTQSMPVASG